MSGNPSAGSHGVVTFGRPVGGARLGRGERDVVGTHVGGSVPEPADCLHPRRDERPAFARLDGVGRHPDGLKRRRAVAVDGDARNIEPGEQGSYAPHVVARLAGRLPAPDDHVFDIAAVQLGNLLHHRAQHQRGEVVGPAVDE